MTESSSLTSDNISFKKPSPPLPCGPRTRPLTSAAHTSLSLFSTTLCYLSKVSCNHCPSLKKTNLSCVLSISDKVQTPSLTFIYSILSLNEDILILGCVTNRLRALFSESAVCTDRYTNRSLWHNAGSAVAEMCTGYFKSRGEGHLIHLENEWERKVFS